MLQNSILAVEILHLPVQGDEEVEVDLLQTIVVLIRRIRALFDVAHGLVSAVVFRRVLRLLSQFMILLCHCRLLRS